MRAIRVAVVEEHDIFRRGLVGCLREDPMTEVVVDQASGPVPRDLAVAVVSPGAAATERFACPLVVCAPDPRLRPPVAEGNVVSAVLPRSTLTVDQLVATVRAAAAGLLVQATADAPLAPLDERRMRVLRMLAEGADTQEISRSLRYSERTIKGLIGEIERSLGARSRAQAVAEGIRQGLI